MPHIIKQSIECWLFVGNAGPDASVLLLRAGANERHPAYWQPVTGGIEPGETPEQACLREVREETGVVLEPKMMTRLDWSLDVRVDEQLTIHKTLFVAVTEGQQVQISDEHIGWQWVLFGEVDTLLFWPSSHETHTSIKRFFRG